MKLMLKNVRLAFPSLFEATSYKGSAPSYSGAFIVPKDHPQFKEIEKAIEEVATEKWAAKAKATLVQLKAADKVAFHNGDTKADYVGFPGNYYISSRNKKRPLVIDKDKTHLTQADGKPYAGSFVNASVTFWAQDNDFGKRINCSLEAVQFVKDGDAFSGSAPASEDEFDVVADDLV